MPNTMLAVVKYGQEDGQVELREVPVPEIGPDDVLLEVAAAGVCGSDIEFWRHSITFPIRTPVIQGHEFGGVVAEAGERVTDWRVGDEVVSETAAFICGKCRLCRTGHYNLCRERLGFGYGLDGAFAKYVRVRQGLLHRKPPEVSWNAAALTEPTCVAYNALVVQSEARPGEPVAILGPGAIGLLCLQVAKALGASPVLITGTTVDARRLDLARRLGADHVVNAQEVDPVEVALDLTGGEGIPLVIDAAGNSATIRQSLDMVARNGQITKIGWGKEPVGFSLDPIVAKAVRYQGTFSHTWPMWEAVLEMVRAGRLDPEALVTHELQLREWLTSYELVEARQAVKVVLRPE
ncbi:MAG: zinc-binding dehydrogenase [Armatimonadetes bacterium]|nr:zinc-binding dehydrogenase [Armatimonadota bacterium]